MIRTITMCALLALGVVSLGCGSKADNDDNDSANGHVHGENCTDDHDGVDQYPGHFNQTRIQRTRLAHPLDLSDHNTTRIVSRLCGRERLQEHSLPFHTYVSP